jgi:hypothetical protein
MITRIFLVYNRLSLAICAAQVSQQCVADSRYCDSTHIDGLLRRELNVLPAGPGHLSHGPNRPSMFCKTTLDSKVTSGFLILPMPKFNLVWHHPGIEMIFFANLQRHMSNNVHGRQRHGSSNRSGNHGGRDSGFWQDGHDARGASCAS